MYSWMWTNIFFWFSKYTSAQGTVDSDNCILCSPGKYSKETGATQVGACIDCEKSWFQEDPGSIVCNECDADTEMTEDKGKTVCLKCEGGKYLHKTISGSTTSKTCGTIHWFCTVVVAILPCVCLTLVCVVYLALFLHNRILSQWFYEFVRSQQMHCVCRW